MNEKQLARYLRAVRRRLSLSGQMKDRVMDDLRSSINERREAGQTDAEIFAALGPAKQAAAELTAQLPGYAFRKKPAAVRLPWRGGACAAGRASENRHESARLCVRRRYRRRGRADGNFHRRAADFLIGRDVIAAGIVLVLGLIGYLLLRRLPPKKG